MPLMMQDFYKPQQQRADIANTQQATLASQANTAKTIQDTGIEKEQWDLQKAYRESMAKAPTQSLADLSQGYTGQIATFTASAQRNATLAKIALQYGQTKDAEDYEKNARDDASQAQKIQADEKQRVASALSGVKTQDDLTSAISSLRDQGVDVDAALQKYPFLTNINDPRTKPAISALVKQGLTADQIQKMQEQATEFANREADRKQAHEDIERDRSLTRASIAAARESTNAFRQASLEERHAARTQAAGQKQDHTAERQQDLVMKQADSFSSGLQRTLDRISENAAQGMIPQDKADAMTKQAQDNYVKNLKATLSAAQKRGVDLSFFEDPMGLLSLKRR